MSLEADAIVETIVRRFHELERDLKSKRFEVSNEKWTRDVLTTICLAGKELNCTVGANPRYVCPDNRDGTEWLYDVYWLEYDDEGWVASMPLAGESEWGGRDKADYDFQKLLVARATVRVMVYEGRPRDGGTPGFAKRFAYHVQRFRGTAGDTYLLIGYDRSGSDWRFRYDKVVAGQPGETPAVEPVAVASLGAPG